MKSIAVIDYGMGNLHSIAKALERVAPHHRVVVTDAVAELRAAERLVMPGQGAIGQCMARLDHLGLAGAIRELAPERPFLGICLGLQALLTRSDEDGGTAALDLFRGDAERFAGTLNDDDGARIRIPHMGWNRVERTEWHPLWAGIPDGERFYFVHSYYARAETEGVAAKTHYGTPFACALARGNIFAVQFHPEKSQAAGLRLLANFVAWPGGDAGAA